MCPEEEEKERGHGLPVMSMLSSPSLLTGQGQREDVKGAVAAEPLTGHSWPHCHYTSHAQRAGYSGLSRGGGHGCFWSSVVWHAAVGPDSQWI